MSFKRQDEENGLNQLKHNDPSTPPRRVALLMDHAFAYNRLALRGIYEHAMGHANWVVHQANPEPRNLPALREWAPDGVIGHISDPEFAEGLAGWGGPVVSTTSALGHDLFPVVDVDHAAAGRLGAEHFLEHGHVSFAFFGSDTTGFSIERENGFRQRIETAGFEVQTCHADSLLSRHRDESWIRTEEEIERWLLQLPRPCAVFVSNDVSARTVTNAANQLGLRIPEELSILSVDNDEFECLFTTPTLSSIEIPAVQIGRAAARILHQLLEGESSESGTLLPPVQVIERQSTDLVATKDHAVIRAVSYIRSNLTDQISVDDIADAAECSRRTLERRFREALDRTVHDELMRQRLARAKRLLQETEMPLEKLAKQTGFTDSRRLGLVFRKKFGTTPAAFRRSLN